MESQILQKVKLVGHIGRDKLNRLKYAVVDENSGRYACTYWKLLERLGNYSLMSFKLDTGRTHQIRVHLASKKLPIVGDKSYNPSSNISKNTSQKLTNIIRNFPRQALHAKFLSFECPETKKQISYEAAIPEDINNLILDIKNIPKYIRKTCFLTCKII